MTKERIVLVTGAASGIGRRLATGLAERGDTVVAADIDEEGLAESAEAESWGRHEVETAVLDVSRYDDWEELVDGIVETHGGLDLLVHSAAVVHGGRIAEAERDEIDAQVDVNLKGTAYGTRIVGAQMARQGSGHIVNFGSLASLAPVPGLGVYASTKFGVRGLTLAAAQEYRDDGVDVTLVMPDTVDTPLLEKATESGDAGDLGVAFAGAMLTVDDIEEVFFERVLPKRPLEVPIPRGQGALTRLANLAPGLLHVLEPLLEKIGGANLEAYRQRRES